MLRALFFTLIAFSSTAYSQELSPGDLAQLGASAILPRFEEAIEEPSGPLRPKISVMNSAQRDLDRGLVHRSGIALETVSSEEGLVQIKVQLNDSTERFVVLGKTLHRLSLLQSLKAYLGLGFTPFVPVREFRIDFSGPEQKTKWITQLETATEAPVSRWVIAESENSLVLRDLIVSNSSLIAAASPQRSADETLSYVLSDFSEDINLSNWIVGQVGEDSIEIGVISEHLSPLTPKIAQDQLFLLQTMTLDRIRAMVGESALPSEVSHLISTKMQTRIRSVLQFYGVEYELEEKITEQDTESLQLPAQAWPGYARSFSDASTSNAAEVSGMRSLVRSRGFSLLLAYAVKRLNQAPVLHSNLELELNRNNPDYLSTVLEDRTGVADAYHKTLGVWGFSFVSGQLILARDLVAGSVLGTQNRLQIVDQVGIRLNIGGQLQLTGIAFPVGVYGDGDLAISRTFSHVIPLQDFAEANQHRFQPVRLTKLLSQGMMKARGNWLKKLLKVGESLIVTDSIVGGAGIRSSAQFYTWLDVSMAAAGSAVVINRIQILRKDENTFQVYQSGGEKGQFDFAYAMGVRFKYPKALRFLLSKATRNQAQYYPIVTLRKSRSYGNESTSFYSVALNAETESWLGAAAKSARTELLDSHVKPLRFSNEITDRRSRAKFLWWQSENRKTANLLQIETPEGQKRTFVRDFFGKSRGKSLDRPSNRLGELLGGVAETMISPQFSVGRNPNPFLSLNGKSINQTIEYEAEQQEDGSVFNPYVKVSKVYQGFELNRRRLRRLVKDFENVLNQKVLLPEEFEDPQSLYLYRASLITELSPAAIERIQKLSMNTIYGISSISEKPIMSDQDDDEEGEEEFYDRRGFARNFYALVQDFTDSGSSKSLMKAISMAEQTLTRKQWLGLVGGEKNLHVYTRFEAIAHEGYDEKTGNPISKAIAVPTSYLGQTIKAGPLSEMQYHYNLTEGELLAQWLTDT